MKLIVGLGNPGRAYSSTKHNVGFRTVKEIGRDNRIRFRKDTNYEAALGRGDIKGEDVVLLLPFTFMNLSGRTVKAVFLREFERLEDVMVIYDDINLNLGKVRLRKKGSSGGHKGINSIIESLHSEGFLRLRMGIATGLHSGDITDYVLSPFERKDKKAVSETVELAKDAVYVWIEEGIDAAMNRFNS